MPIITHLKEKLKNLRTLLDIPRFIGPLATIAFTLIYHAAAVYFGIEITLIWLTVFVVGGTFLSGLKGGGVTVIWAAAYALYTLPLSRAIQVIIGLALIVAVVGSETRKLREFYKAADELLNGNAAKLNRALSDLRIAKNKIREARHLIELSEDGFGNVLAKVVGYKGLRDTIEAVNKFYDDPENVKRLQDTATVEHDKKGNDD